VQLEGLGQLKKIHPIRIRTHDILVCSIVPQPIMLPHVPTWKFGLTLFIFGIQEFVYHRLVPGEHEHSSSKNKGLSNK
jgi:hypothetical protein